MAFRFAVENDLLVFTPEILMHQAYAQVYHYDDDKFHQNALRDLLWVQFMNEEEGPYSEYDAIEKVSAINMQVYGVPTFQPESTRWHLRDVAAELFREMNHTIEGQLITTLNEQIMQITRIIKSAGKDISKMSDDDVDNYLNRVNAQSDRVNKFIDNKTKMELSIQKRGGKTKPKNQGNAITTPNEARMMDRDKIIARMKLREQSQQEEAARVAAEQAEKERLASEKRDKLLQEEADRQTAKEAGKSKKKKGQDDESMPAQRLEDDVPRNLDGTPIW